jgi:glycerol-3-phosphate dehydrogenase
MIPKTDDGRVLFAIPWYGKVVVGTTDTPLNDITLEPRALDEEIDFILKTAGKYLTKPPQRKDIKCVFAGLRPLAANPEKPEATKEVSRRHKITLSPSGLLSIIGGKWTSYRRMAEETIDKAIRSGILGRKPCATKDFRFYSENGRPKDERLKIYGSGAVEIEKMIEKDPGKGELIDNRLPYTKAEIIWISRNEMPVKLEDILARRTRALFLDAGASLDSAPLVAQIMAGETGAGNEWIEKELNDYKNLVSKYL